MLRKRRGLFLLGVLGMVALLLACAAGEEEEATPVPGETPGATATKVVLPTATPEQAEIVPGGILRLSTYADPPYWDPNQGPSGEVHGQINHAHAFLVNMRYGPEYPQWDFTVTTDGVAESWEISDDGLIYTFHLKKGVKFQNKPPLNGRELVAEDVKWSIQNIIDTPGSPRGQPLSAIERMECPDKYTLVCYLSEPRASLLGLMANPYVEIQPPDLSEYFGDVNSPDAVIGAGPFMLKEYTPGVRIVWEKNPDYYRADEGLPYLDEIHYSIIADSSTTLAGFRAENIDIRGISRLDLESVRGTNPDMYCYESEVGASAPALTMRTDQPPFDDVRVRRAVSMALDRQAVIDANYLGYGIEAHGPIHPAAPWYLEDQGECMKYYEHNPEEAKRLLAEAGYPDGFDTTFNTTSGWGTTFLEYAELWVDFLSKVGINATIKADELGAHYVKRLAKYEGLSWTYVWGGATIDPDVWLNVMYQPGGYVNYSAVDDPKLTELLMLQQTALTPEKRQEYLDEIQRHMACERYQIQWPLAYGVTCMQPWVHNYKRHAADMSRGRYYEIVWVDETSPSRK